MNKKIVIIVSRECTGPRFFADPLSKMAEDSYSAHEPDFFEALTRRTWRRPKIFGLSHMAIGRLLGGRDRLDYSRGPQTAMVEIFQFLVAYIFTK